MGRGDLQPVEDFFRPGGRRVPVGGLEWGLAVETPDQGARPDQVKVQRAVGAVAGLDLQADEEGVLPLDAQLATAKLEAEKGKES